MSRLVLDASAASRVVLAHPDVSSTVLDALAEADRVIAPQLFFSEIANTLWKHVRADELSEQDAVERFREARDLVTHPADDADFAEEALVAAGRFDHPAYDCLYAVLARRNSCPVLTADSRLKSLLSKMRIDSL